jgi:hypothetical protein
MLLLHSRLASEVREGEQWVSGSRLVRTLTLVQWSQMGSFLQRYFWALSHTTASSRPGGSDRQVLEERRCLISHAHKEDSLSFPPPLPSHLPFYLLGLIITRSVMLLSAPSRSSYSRLLHRHGERKSHGRGAARSG